MSALQMVITDAGRNAAVKADHTGATVSIKEIGIGRGLWNPGRGAKGLQDEIKRLPVEAGGNPKADQLHFEIRDMGRDTYTLGEFGLFLEDGTLFAIYSRTGGQAIMEKTADVPLLLAVDISLTTLSTDNIRFGDTDFRYPPATETVSGVARIASLAEAAEGSDHTKMITPKTQKAAMENHNTSDLAHPDIRNAMKTLVSVGDFGLGVSEDPGVVIMDANKAKTNGCYRLHANAVNGPGQPTSSALIVARPGIQNWVHQIAYMGKENGKIFHRVYDGTTWTAWESFWTSANGGENSGLDADLLDGHEGAHYLDWEHLTNIPQIVKAQASSYQNLPEAGWYTIATNDGSRASAKFVLQERTPGRHQTVHFYAAHHYGAGNSITVLSDSAYSSGGRFRRIRIKDSGTYDGAMLQVEVVGVTTSANISLLENTQFSGWKICDFIQDGMDPGNLPDHTQLTNIAASVNLSDGNGINTTEDIIVKGKKTLTHGDFGLGVNTDPGIEIADANDARANGFYRLKFEALNGPAVKSSCALIVARAGVQNWVHQTAFAGSGKGYIYHRAYDGSSWTEWENIWTSDNGGEGSGLDADKLHGAKPSISANVDTIVKRSSSGSVYAKKINTLCSEIGDVKPSHVMVLSGNDNFIKKQTVNHFLSGMKLATKEDLHTFIPARHRFSESSSFVLKPGRLAYAILSGGGGGGGGASSASFGGKAGGNTVIQNSSIALKILAGGGDGGRDDDPDGGSPGVGTGSQAEGAVFSFSVEEGAGASGGAEAVSGDACRKGSGGDLVRAIFMNTSSSTLTFSISIGKGGAGGRGAISGYAGKRGYADVYFS